jgi:hypothetical protein
MFCVPRLKPMVDVDGLMGFEKGGRIGRYVV